MSGDYTLCMALRLLAATTSQGKLRDFRTAAHAYSVFIDPLPVADSVTAPEEDGETFLANATLKAVYYSRLAPGQLVLADDSGLEVDVLGGAPGVRSARFAADSGLVDSPDANDNSDVWNNIVLLQRLAKVPADQRTARYRCVLVAARDGEVLQSAEGAVDGLILEGPRGTGGFGYDPLFYLPALERTMAEIDLETKLSLSHRGRALAALLPKLLA
jgi:XTP/dITP diphosphohydrolase